MFLHQTRSSGICMYAPITKQQSSQWKIASSTCPKIGEAGQVKLREHVYCFLWQWANASRGVYSSMPNCESTVLRTVPKTLEKDFRRRSPDKCYTQDRLLHHDTASSHTSVQRFWTKNNMAVVSHPSSRLTCLLMPFSFSQRWKSSRRDKDSRIPRRLTF
jgi:hypothetical protein